MIVNKLILKYQLDCKNVHFYVVNFTFKIEL